LEIVETAMIILVTITITISLKKHFSDLNTILLLYTLCRGNYTSCIWICS